MKTLQILKIGAVLTLLAIATAAEAHRGHVRSHVVIGWAPWPWPTYSYRFSEPDPVPVLVEPLPVAPLEAQPAQWYYCEAAGAFYPYVQSCPTGWKTVPAEPQKTPVPNEKK